MTERERLIELLSTSGWNLFTDAHCKYEIADYLLENGVIVPPCKVGDVVWYSAPYRLSGEVLPYKIACKSITQSRKGVWHKVYRAYLLRDEKTTDVSVMFTFDEVGYKVFLTREEAEKVLKERCK